MDSCLLPPSVPDARQRRGNLAWLFCMWLPTSHNMQHACTTTSIDSATAIPSNAVFPVCVDPPRSSDPPFSSSIQPIHKPAAPTFPKTAYPSLPTTPIRRDFLRLPPLPARPPYSPSVDLPSTSPHLTSALSPSTSNPPPPPLPQARPSPSFSPPIPFPSKPPLTSCK
ncbi:hypothetical protein C8Q76DRAFT_803072 [Earliella scabrosa]|nr:hypothetical protein C8Q76DRAFT_803072 [Earliella scabrosa]